MTRYERYDSNGALWEYYIYLYDNDSHRIGYECYTEDGILEWRQVNRYDDAGNYLGYDEFDASGNLLQTTVQS